MEHFAIVSVCLARLPLPDNRSGSLDFLPSNIAGALHQETAISTGMHGS